MKAFHNIETRPVLGRRIGYEKSSGDAVRIYGESRHGYLVRGKRCRTLAEVSAYLETL